MSRIHVDELDKYYDSQFIGKRVQRLERINMQMQGRITFLENLVADIAVGGHQNEPINAWTCSVKSQFLGTHQTKIGAKALAKDNCYKQRSNNNIDCRVWPDCEQHQI